MSRTVPRRVLVVEDDQKIARVLIDYLTHDGHSARSVSNGRVAVQEIKAGLPDLVVLDLMLPGLDGIAVCRAVRAFTNIPILMLTARVEEIDRLLGLDTGADDYVCKPFSPREVMARVRALLRRAMPRTPDMPARWVIDDAARRIQWNGRLLPLTSVEFRILRVLLNAPGRVYSRAQLLDSVHDDLRDVSDRAIDSHVKNIRRKLEAVDPDCDCIASVYGVGYRFELTNKSC